MNKKQSLKQAHIDLLMIDFVAEQISGKKIKEDLEETSEEYSEFYKEDCRVIR